MAVEKEAAEKKMKAAVASIMYPAYRTTGMLRRMLPSNQQQKADLWGRVHVSVAVVLRRSPEVTCEHQRVAEAYRPEYLNWETSLHVLRRVNFSAT